jgi:hypothetical protein
VNTAAAQTGDGRDFSDRPPCTVRSHERVEALTCGFIEPRDRQVESRLQLAFMPDTWSECFTRFHALRIVIYDGGVQQPGHENATVGSIVGLSVEGVLPRQWHIATASIMVGRSPMPSLHTTLDASAATV